MVYLTQQDTLRTAGAAEYSIGLLQCVIRFLFSKDIFNVLVPMRHLH